MLEWIGDTTLYDNATLGIIILVVYARHCHNNDKVFNYRFMSTYQDGKVKWSMYHKYIAKADQITFYRAL